MGFGAVYKAYNDHVSGISGLHENDQLLTDDYLPRSKVHKSYSLKFIESSPPEGWGRSGNTVGEKLDFELTVLFQRKRGESYADFHEDCWDLMGTYEKSIITFADGRGDIILKDGIKLEEVDQNVSRFIYAGSLSYNRNLS